MLMAIALVPTTVFTYGYLFRQVPFFKNGTCSGVSGSGIFGLKWPFALANLVRPSCVVGWHGADECGCRFMILLHAWSARSNLFNIFKAGRGERHPPPIHLRCMTDQPFFQCLRYSRDLAIRVRFL